MTEYVKNYGYELVKSDNKYLYKTSILDIWRWGNINQRRNNEIT